MNAKLSTIEYHLPAELQDTAALRLENPSWDLDKIIEKTGIRQRFVAARNETAVDLAAAAGEKLLRCNPQAREATFLILVTQSPDYALPTSACILQDRLGLPQRCLTFDINQGCSGFVTALSVATSLIHSGLAATGIIICSETYSKYISPTDRTCRPLFSDAAAAVYIEATDEDCIGPFEHGTDGSCYSHLIVRDSGARGFAGDDLPRRGHLEMRGSDVFLFTMRVLPPCIDELLSRAGLVHEDVNLYVFHQASKLVIDNLARTMSLPEDKVFTNYEYVGNTVSASIPIALKDAAIHGRLKFGDRVLIAGFGVGLSWGAALMRWMAK